MSIYLDCAASPLQRGITLVEASAGTGKTYAIAMLVLRAVCEEEIPIDQILVVTFTRAATEELRSRIRQRLVEARDLLAGTEETGKDKTMTAWLATVDDEEKYIRLLQSALLDIDRAEIFTIHSFCQRMLQEQALECGQLFDVELQGDINHIRQQIVEDFWRRHVYAMDHQSCGAILAQCSTPEQLQQSIKAAGSVYDLVEPATGSIGELADDFAGAFANLQYWYLEHGAQLRESFNLAIAAKKFKGALNTEEKIDEIWLELDNYLRGRTMTPTGKIEFLSVDGVLPLVTAATLKITEEPQLLLRELELPDALATSFLAAWRLLVIGFRKELLGVIQDQLEERLQNLGLMSFDDLIRRLDLALKKDRGDLQRLLSHRYGAAFIDEFQDTDSAQWSIFSTIFGLGNHFLYLIGDPKQAIYKFRGADIHSYFQAKNEASLRLTLRHNYRSHPDLVKVVNDLFSWRDKVFAYSEDRLGFDAVEPARTSDDGELLRDGRPLGVMACWQLGAAEKRKKWFPGVAADRLRQETIAEILSLLDPNTPVTYRQIKNGQDASRILQPLDIAVLVRSNRHAQDYLKAFAEAGVPAVVASKQSVYDSREGKELYRLLTSLAEPGNTFLLKSAMTISWFGLNGHDLSGIWSDESIFEDWLNRFLLYNRMWQEKGFLIMMQSLLREENVLLHLSATPLGERRIANVHHLLELIQEVETEDNLGPAQTLLRLESCIADERSSEDTELRLESDEDAVRIITMHSAKGLQYPVVFCPYLWYRNARLESERELITCHENERLVVDLGSDRFRERHEQALEEELAEELRLLYVAVTRAQVRCYIMMANCQKTSKGSADTSRSSLGYLFFDGKQKEQEEQEAIVRQFVEAAGGEYRVLSAVRLDADRSAGFEASPLKLSPQVGTGRSLQTDYQMTSYSAMAALSEHEDHGSDADSVEPEGENGGAVLHPGLPAGASFGNLIHDSLELISFKEIGTELSLDAIESLCHRYGQDVEPNTIQQLLLDVVNTPLTAGNEHLAFSLAELDQSRALKEMAFYFHLNRLDTERVNKVLAGEPGVIQLAAKSMRGYLTGFVDLVCEHDGRYYVIDYKTNYLGDNRGDYQGEKLVRAMASHNYGLQYWIYTLVLHRYLQNVLEGYDYSTHFGGVMYLFVRGMRPETPGSGVYYAYPDKNKLQQLDTLLGGGDER